MKPIPYATQWIDEEDIDSVERALRSPFLTQGPLVERFERDVADYCGVKYAVALNSGTSALHAACFAAGISGQSEVISSPITFVATANAVLYCGGKPVFVDVQPDTINIDHSKISENFTSATKAIIPVHFAGYPAALTEIQEIAKKHNLVVLEDAAHAFGAEYRGAKIGSCCYSDMAILSFHAVKHITTGEGGMVTTNNESYYKKLLMFRTHGITRDPSLLSNKTEGPWYYEMQSLGFNYRLTDFQSALGIQQLRKLDQFIAARRRIVTLYKAAFKNLSGLTMLNENETIAKSAWHIFPIMVRTKRRAKFELLRQAGIGVNVHYLPVYLQPYYQGLGYLPGLCPIAEKYYSQTITLPLYPKMSDAEVQYVIDQVKKVVADG